MTIVYKYMVVLIEPYEDSPEDVSWAILGFFDDEADANVVSESDSVAGEFEGDGWSLEVMSIAFQDPKEVCGFTVIYPEDEE